MSNGTNWQQLVTQAQALLTQALGSAPAPGPGPSATTNYTGTLKSASVIGMFGAGNFPVAVLIETDDAPPKSLSFTFGDPGAVWQLLGLNAGTLSKARASAVSLVAEYHVWITSAAAGNELPPPHVQLVVAPPVSTDPGAVSYLLSYSDV